MLTETEAVILNSRKFGDTSKILTLFSRDYGRLSVLAKGARQKKSKFRGILEPINIIYLNFYKRPNRDLHLLSSAEIKYPLTKIFNSYYHLSLGLSILESLYYTISENMVYDELYLYTLETLIKLDNSDDNPFVILVEFQLKLAHYLGFGMNFDFSDKELENDYIYFSIVNGNFAKYDRNYESQLFRINHQLYRKINMVGKENSELSGLNFSDSEKSILLELFSRYFSYHLEKKYYLKSQKLLINNNL